MRHPVIIGAAALFVVIGTAGAAGSAGAGSAGVGPEAKSEPSQAELGAAVFADHCAICHGAHMQGLDVSPPLRSQAFVSEWRGRPVVELARRIRATMPLNAPGTLGAAQAAAVTAAILRANDLLSAGAADIPAASADQKQFIIGS